jgi:Ca-activated chloride channel family protein
MIIFIKPQYLMLLFVIPLMVFVHVSSIVGAKKRAVKFANFEAIKRVSGVEMFSKNLTILYLNIAIVVLLVFSMSGMSFTKQVETSAVSFVLAIDSSRSMGATDMLPTRLDAAKIAAIDFLKMIPEKTRMGIVSFAGTITIEQEITDETVLLEKAINQIEIKTTGGTNAFDALITASNVLINEDAKSIIFISDGNINVNELQSIIDYNQKNNIVVHSLGVGTEIGGEEAELGGFFTASEEGMKIMAEKTGGKYYHVSNVEDFYSAMRDMIEITKKIAVFNMSLYLDLAAMVLLILTFFLVNTRYRTLP